LRNCISRDPIRWSAPCRLSPFPPSDRIGRKATLIATSLLTGLSTFAVGFVPGYA